ncbi:TAP-like protein-domain-containing protein [Colletotrichum navitas]|uniref:TAP-like protein-domain-containing protein n=1 Tax=Colletotrichum navitas TaxID=681940 RepID=A0AAD8Q4B1_9PEZI|nr:TAP-like protein-domain-containing protein [Colletotrichum navitas]KAK1595612.1 TAP-like protein-domain-containing protein [Colletotrichum navitas]
MRFSAILFALAGIARAGERDYPDLNGFNWSTITPSTKLEYHPCYEEFQCARLTVPLDWLDEKNEYTVALAIIKLPAKVPDHDPAFGGTIFTNPGGPGGSGVGLLLREGHLLQDTVDGNKKYEILSWDPRGVQFTSPKADCYEDLLARDLDTIQRLAIGPLDASPDALRRQWARIQAYGKLCTQSAVNGSILPYASTASVVRDMVEMLDKIQELRDEEVAAKFSEEERAQRPMELRGAKQLPRLQYWGFSYGSLLGNTFASMYPGRVQRIILDGIVDADDYMAAGWTTNLQDSEKIVEFFYTTCFASGRKCALSRPSDRKWQDIRERVIQLIKQLDDSPVSVLDGKFTKILTGYDVTVSFVRPLYKPYQDFKKLAEKINSAIEGNYTALIETATADVPKLDDTCSHPNSSAPPSAVGDGTQAILCSDGEDSTNLTIADYRAYITKLESQSPTFAGYWSEIRFSCMGWHVRPKWRFAGPFATPEPDPAVVEGRPTAPLLFLTSRLDPVTPLRNALKESGRHPGSAVVIQESVGHCSTTTSSRCTTRIIREYLEHGIVPKSGTVCQADCDVWDGDACLRSSMGIDLRPLAPSNHRSHPLIF